MNESEVENGVDICDSHNNRRPGEEEVDMDEKRRELKRDRMIQSVRTLGLKARLRNAVLPPTGG